MSSVFFKINDTELGYVTKLIETDCAVIAPGSATTEHDLDRLPSGAAMLFGEADPDFSSGPLRWFLLTSSDSRVQLNGSPLASTGIAQLSRKDEILLVSDAAVQRCFFSDEESPEPEVRPDDLSPDACCARCQLPLASPSPTAEIALAELEAAGVREEDADDDRISRKPLIRCGGCGTLVHAHGCWDYEPTCQICLAPTTGHTPWHPRLLD